MRCFVVLMVAFAATLAGAAKPAGSTRLGVKTPGVQIPFTSLKAETELETPAKPAWLFFSDALFVPGVDGLTKVDAKTNKMGAPVTGLNKPCGGMASAFGSLWVPACGEGALARLDAKDLKVSTKLAVGTSSLPWTVTATADSIWMLVDDRTTLVRIDPDQNIVVSELRLPAGCRSLEFGETALWIACPNENKVLRVNPATNLVEQAIAVSAQPESVAIGEGSVWVLCRKEGKIDRIDPKTNKVAKTIELQTPAATGNITVGQGYVWVTTAGFPVTRIDPKSETVLQQFYGEGGGAIVTSKGAIWLSNVAAGKVWRIDPKLVQATLAE